MAMSHVKINNSLFLNTMSLNKDTVPAPTEVPVNHIAVIDCSGSMSFELPKIQEQLINKLPSLMRKNDTFSMVWFSGRGECGILFEAEPISTLKDLQNVNNAIKRWLAPVGATGFKDPIETVISLSKKLAKKNGNPCAMFFLTDGWENQWSKADVLSAVESLSESVSSATFVEYGHYADHDLLLKMAEKVGGSLIAARGFKDYEPALADALQRRVAKKRVEVGLEQTAISGIAFAASDGAVVTFEVKNGKVSVPEGTPSVSYLSNKPAGKSSGEATDASVYAALSVFAARAASNTVADLLKANGDVALIDKFSTCFGKQKYADFVASCTKAAFDPAARLVSGRDTNRMPADDAFTVFDLLNELVKDPNAKLKLDSKAFVYNAISLRRVDADPNALTFQALQNADGYPLNGLVFNEERANISINVTKRGEVDISSRLASAPNADKLPAIVPTNVFRSYSIVTDGIINVEALPVTMSSKTWERILKRAPQLETLTSSSGETVDVIIDLQKLPVINKQMVKTISAKDLFSKEWKLCHLRARQKVLKHYLKEFQESAANTSGMASLYGKENADWLAEQGITDNGFSPKSTKQAAVTDVYMGVKLACSIKGYASDPPSMNELAKRRASGKALTGPAALLDAAELDVRAQLDSKKTDAARRKWLETETEHCVEQTRELIRDMAKIKFSVIVGRTWFSEFASMDEGTLDLTVDGDKLTGIVNMSEVEIKV